MNKNKLKKGDRTMKKNIEEKLKRKLEMTKNKLEKLDTKKQKNKIKRDKINLEYNEIIKDEKILKKELLLHEYMLKELEEIGELAFLEKHKKF